MIHVLQFPPRFEPLFRPSRYKVFFGGRGSAKSYSAARALLLMAAEKRARVLCTREYQCSMTESVHALLSRQIRAMNLAHKFEIQNQAINGVNGSEFIFYGIATNPEKIKSTEGADVCWVEEGEHVSEKSWEILIPTIREENSEIWVTFNPDQESDPTYQRFVVNSPPDAVVVRVNWDDNPWFPETLRREKDYLFRVDPDAANCVWGGECRRNGSAQILVGKYVVESFTPPTEECWDGPYYGADWGFANDPTTLVKCWIDSHRRRLMVEHEAWALGCELDSIPALFELVPGARQHQIFADCARPETISHIASKGFRISAAEKWSGSVEDGISFLRSFEQIVIHPRCVHAIEEARLYSYRRDRLTGTVLPEILGKHDHVMDSLRYALGLLITRKSTIAIWQQLGKQDLWPTRVC